jgi:hypothetical protein
VEENNPLKFDIDITGALKSGYNQTQIAEQVAELANAQLTKTGQKFDYTAAKAAGITDADIIKQFGRNVHQGSEEEYVKRRGFEGLVEGGGGLAGLIRGGQAGIALTSFIPVPGARIVGGLVGGLGGLILGHFFGGKAADIEYASRERGVVEGVSDVVTGEYRRPEAVPEDRPMGEAAYTIGATVPYIAAPWLLPKQGVNLGAAKYLDNISRMQARLTGALGLTKNAQNVGVVGGTLEGAKTLGRAGIETAAQAAKLPGRVGRGVEYLGTAAQRASATPKITLGIEAGGITGSAAGAYTAQRLAPEDAGWRFVGEITGGFIGTAPSIRFIGRLGQGGEGFVGRFSEEARQESVADRLYQIVEGAAKKDPDKVKMSPDVPYEEGVATEKIIQLLLADDMLGDVSRTAAQKAGIPILNDIEVNLLRQNLANGLGVTSRASAERTLDGIRLVLKALSDSSDPKALQDYAAIRNQYFEDVLVARLSQESLLAADKAGVIGKKATEAAEAARQAAPAIARVEAGLDTSRDELGELTKDAVYTVLKEARKQENDFWKKIDNTIEIDAKSLADKFEDLKSSLSTAKQQKLPSEMRTFIEELQQGATAQAQKKLDDLGEGAKTLGEMALRNAGNDIDGAIGQLRRMAEMPAYSPQEKQNFQQALNYLTAKKSVDAGELGDALPTTLGELRKFRSDMLDLAADFRAGANPDRKMARIAGNLAEQSLKVLDEAGETAGLSGLKEYDDARAFSRALNKVFSEGFVGTRFLAKKPTGEDVLPPEIFVDDVLSGTQSKITLRMRQLEDSVNFMAREGATPEAQKISQEAFTSLREVEDGVLRLAAAEGVLDPDGNVVPNALNRFMKKYGPVMKNMKMNSLLGDLSDMQKAQILFREWQDQNSIFNEAMQRSVTFRNYIGEEDAGSVITKALGDPMRRPSTPAKNFKNLIRFVNRKDAPEDVKRALYDSLLDRAYMYGGGEGVDQFSFRRMHEYLFKSVARGEDSPMAMLKKAGIVDDNEIERLVSMFDVAKAARKTQTATGKDVPEMELMNMDGQLEEGFVRIVSAGFGPNLLKLLGKIPGIGRMFEATTGGSLVAANVTSQAMVNFFENMPKTMIRDIWKKVVEDPQFTAQMLKLGKERADAGLGKKMSFADEFKARRPSALDATARTYLQQAVPAYLERSLTEQELRAPEQQQPVPVQQPAPVAPPQAAAPASAPRPAAQGSANPQQRSMYAALFPNDPVSGLARQQGIGSLMG